MIEDVCCPFTMIFRTLGNTSWVCDPRLVSYALEQAERLISQARANEVMHNFARTLSNYQILILTFLLTTFILKKASFWHL